MRRGLERFDMIFSDVEMNRAGNLFMATALIVAISVGRDRPQNSEPLGVKS